MYKRLLIPFLIIVAFLAVACGGGEAAEEPSGDEEAAGEEEAGGEEEAAGEEEAEAAGARQLRIAHAYPIRVDPAIGADFASNTSLTNIYDTLVAPDPEGAPQPWLAESWEVSDDSLTYTFTLRDDITFHDGSPVEASDVVFSFDRMMTIGQGNAYLYEGRVESVEAVDERTVEFTIAEPYALFLHTLYRGYIQNEEVVMANAEAEGDYGEFGDYGTTWLQTNDAGSGPYTVAEFQQEEFLLLEKHEDWWDAEQFVDNAPDEVRIIPGPEPATLRTLMANDELEMSDQWQSADTFQAVDEIDGVDIATFDAVTMLYLYLNTSKPPLDDVHVRRAIAYAFDYDTAAELDWPGTPGSSGPVPKGVAGFNSDLELFTQDLDRARAELEESDYVGELDQYTLEFHWVTEVPDEEKIALLFQSNLQEIGLNVEVTGTPWLTMTELFTTAETSPDIVPIYVNADLPEAGATLFQRYHSSTTGTFFQGEWLLDDTYDGMIEEALATLDRDERFDQYAELQEYLMDLSPTIFAYDQLQKHAYQDYIDWYAGEGEVVYNVMGWNQYFPWIGVNSPS